ncbi:MAG: glutathione transferase GstA [Bacteriovoracaceae bacterium]
MKLYYSPGACSLSPHIIIKEIGLPIAVEKVDLKNKVTASGEDFLKINSKGQVPAFEVSPGEVLTEGVAIVQYLSDLAPEKGLFPQGNGIAKYRQLELLNFISTEIHKGFSPLWAPNLSDDARKSAIEKLNSKFPLLEKNLSNSTYLMGESFTLADAYLFTVLSWANYVKVELPIYLKNYLARVSERPSVQAALREEGLIK